MDFNQYERIVFSEKTTNRSLTKHGYKVGEHLVVSYVNPHQRLKSEQWRVYRFTDGLAAIDTSFRTAEDAIRFAEWLDNIYGEWFILWTEYPHAELFRWTYLTVENGEKYWKYLEELKDKRNIEWNNFSLNINVGQ